MKKLLVLCLALVASSQLMSNNISWSTPPTTLSTSNLNASDPHVAIDAYGDAVAVWVENNLVKATTKPVNMGWSTPVTLSASGGSSPRVVADPNGNATAVWAENGVIKASSKPSTGNWSNSTTLSTSGASSPVIAVDTAGDVIAAWVSGNNIQTSTKLFGGSWQTKVSITSASAAAPHVAMNGSGSTASAVIVWHGTVSGKNIVYASSKLVSSGSWSAETALSSSSQNAEFAKVAVDPNANATAVWYAYDLSGSNYSNVTVQSASLPSGGSWTTPAVLSQGGIMNPANLSAIVRVDNNGNALALWNNSYDGDSFNIESAYKPVRGEWTSATTLIASNTYAYNASLSVSALGDALAVYMFYNGTSIVLQSAESDTTGFLQNSWSVPINLSTGASNGYPSVASTLNGNTLNAVAVWVNNNGTHNLINSVTGTRTIVLPASSLSVTQRVNNFGVFSEYYNTLSWSASSDPNVVSYLIYRNGVLVQQVDASTLQIVDHNAVQNGTVTYGVAAIDNQNSQSAIVTINFN